MIEDAEMHIMRAAGYAISGYKRNESITRSTSSTNNRIYGTLQKKLEKKMMLTR
jgi:hypothetical protein